MVRWVDAAQLFKKLKGLSRLQGLNSSMKMAEGRAYAYAKQAVDK